MKNKNKLIRIIAIAAIIAIGFVALSLTACDNEIKPDELMYSWQGELTAAPANPKINWIYYNTTDKAAYIYDGTAWKVLVKDGQPGQSGSVVTIVDGYWYIDGVNTNIRASVDTDTEPETNTVTINLADGTVTGAVNTATSPDITISTLASDTVLITGDTGSTNRSIKINNAKKINIAANTVIKGSASNGLSVSGGATITGLGNGITITGGTGGGNAIYSGGALTMAGTFGDITGGTGTLPEYQFSQGTALYEIAGGHGIKIENYSALTITSTARIASITGGNATYATGGYGIYGTHATVIIEEGAIIGDITGGKGEAVGGSFGIFLDFNGTLIIDGKTGNIRTGEDEHGGGIYAGYVTINGETGNLNRSITSVDWVGHGIYAEYSVIINGKTGAIYGIYAGEIVIGVNADIGDIKAPDYLGRAAMMAYNSNNYDRGTIFIHGKIGNITGGNYSSGNGGAGLRASGNITIYSTAVIGNITGGNGSIGASGVQGTIIIKSGATIGNIKGGNGNMTSGTGGHGISGYGTYSSYSIRIEAGATIGTISGGAGATPGEDIYEP